MTLIWKDFKSFFNFIATPFAFFVFFFIEGNLLDWLFPFSALYGSKAM